MRSLISRLHGLEGRLGLLAALAAMVVTFAWHVHASQTWLLRNPLPNGYQNEILHLGNALDLFVAWQFHNARLVHDFLFKGYWPPLTYAVAMVPVAILGPSRDAFVAAGYLWLAALMAATFGLGRRLGSTWAGALAAILVSFMPSIYGNLVRFEPNVALTATVVLGVGALLRSAELSRPGWAVLFGVVSGAGMLVDRLAYAFFLWAPALLVGARGARAAVASRLQRHRVLRSASWAVVALLLVAGYYHSFFFALHSEEIFSQAAAGEIIETGEQTEHRAPLAPTTLAFYPMTMLDSQIGPALGLAMLPGVAVGLVALWRSRRGRVVLAWLGGALLLFTLVQKKQVFYTIPVLPAVALAWGMGVASRPSRLMRSAYVAAVLLLAVVQHRALLLGESPLPDFLATTVGGRLRSVDLRPLSGRSPLPEAWVAPRYPQARPPDDDALRLDEVLETVDELRGGLPTFRIGVYSDDHVLYEGYLEFLVRAANPYLRVNGLIGNLQAFYEWARNMDLFIYATARDATWPRAAEVDDTLESFHRQDRSWPVGEVLEGLQGELELRRALSVETGARIYFYTPRVAPPAPEPP